MYVNKHVYTCVKNYTMCCRLYILTMPSLQVVYTTFPSACTQLMASKLEPVHFTNPFDASSVENI